MKQYVNCVLAEAQRLLEAEYVSEYEADSFERHIEYCCHERLVHLLVTLAFAIMTMMSLFIMMLFTQIGTLLLFVIFAVMTAAYAWHYYFLENSVQKMYILSDQLHKKQID